MNRNLVAAPLISQHTVAINPAAVVASTMMQVGNCIVLHSHTFFTGWFTL